MLKRRDRRAHARLESAQKAALRAPYARGARPPQKQGLAASYFKRERLKTWNGLAGESLRGRDRGEPDTEAGKRTRRDKISRRLLPGDGSDEAQHRSPVRSRLSASVGHGLAAGQGHSRAELLEETEVSFWNAVAGLPFGELDKIHEFIGPGGSRSSARRRSPCFAHRTSRRSMPRTPGELMRPPIPQRFTHMVSAP